MDEIMPMKREGESYCAAGSYMPPHPAEARDCRARFDASVKALGSPLAPRGEYWSFGPYRWSCYMRIDAKGEFEHRHFFFLDDAKVRSMVANGLADDYILGRKYKLVLRDDPPVSDDRLRPHA